MDMAKRPRPRLILLGRIDEGIGLSNCRVQNSGFVVHRVADGILDFGSRL